MKNKSAAMEMSMSTIVTIVLIVSFMIVGIYFLNELRKGGTNAIDGINRAVESEINKLFAEDNSRKVTVYPPSREVKIKKGEDSLGFGFSIRNTGENSAKFSYDISAVEASCDMRLPTADSLIALGKSRNNINIAAGSIMEDPIFVKFNIPETASQCKIRYGIEVNRDGELYGSTVDVDLVILSE